MIHRDLVMCNLFNIYAASFTSFELTIIVVFKNDEEKSSLSQIICCHIDKKKGYHKFIFPGCYVDNKENLVITYLLILIAVSTTKNIK